MQKGNHCFVLCQIRNGNTKQTERHLQADGSGSTHSQQDGAGVGQRAEGQADLGGHRQQQAAQLQVTRLREAHRVQVLWDAPGSG